MPNFGMQAHSQKQRLCWFKVQLWAGDAGVQGWGSKHPLQLRFGPFQPRAVLLPGNLVLLCWNELELCQISLCSLFSLTKLCSLSTEHSLIP